MQTEIYTSLEADPPRLRARVMKRTLEVLGRSLGSVARVRVFLRDEGLPEGGPGTHCRLTLDPRRGAAISATSLGRDPEAALSAALRKARRRLRQREEKRITRNRAGRRQRDAA
ncbi:MAG: HPF/RaiA family ribosome-associated protein [Myxococcota bacterium]|nr:HPF/RaiA family ribosome-associated protein [Myxococcota bacterium]